MKTKEQKNKKWVKIFMIGNTDGGKTKLKFWRTLTGLQAATIIENIAIYEEIEERKLAHSHPSQGEKRKE